MPPISWLKMRGYAIIALAERNEAPQEGFPLHPQRHQEGRSWLSAPICQAWIFKHLVLFFPC